MAFRSHLAATFLIAAFACFVVSDCASSQPAETPAAPNQAAVSDLTNYARSQSSTSLLIIQNGRVVLEQYWPAPTSDPQFALFAYGRASDGSPLEDVASQQKSFVAVLLAIAIDKGMLDIEKPVSDYIGVGWSHATREQEARIRVIDVMTMSSGLDESFAYSAPAGSIFFYNTPVYAVTKRIVAAAAHQSLDTITHDWLTAPLGMTNTAWRERPASLASVGNNTGLVTTPRDTARFGQMVLNNGVASNGTHIVSEASLHALFTRSATNPAYGRLWWLNGGEWTARVAGGRRDGPLIAAAPADLVAALGAFDRRLYVVPSKGLVIVRTGATPHDADFDEQLWQRLGRVIG